MTNHLSRARVGFLIFIGVATFVVAIFLVGQKSQLFSSTFRVHANFISAEGVKPGSFVVLSGYMIGTVTDIALTDDADSVRLTLRMNENVREFIKSDSYAEIKQEGLVGNKLINVSIGSPSLPMIQDYEYIQGMPSFGLTGLADNVTAVLDTAKHVGGELRTLLRNLNEGKGTIGMLLTDPSLYNEMMSITVKSEEGLKLATDNIIQLSSLIDRVTKAVELIVKKIDTTVIASNAIARDLENLTSKLNSGEGTMGALLTERKLYDTLMTLLSSLTDVTHDASNAANQTAQSLYAMRGHWLLGRVFAGEEYGQSPPPESSYKRRLHELSQRAAELDRREAELRALAKKLGIETPPEKK